MAPNKPLQEGLGKLNAFVTGSRTRSANAMEGTPLNVRAIVLHFCKSTQLQKLSSDD
jgi:hypothetical protein